MSTHKTLTLETQLKILDILFMKLQLSMLFLLTNVVISMFFNKNKLKKKKKKNKRTQNVAELKGLITSLSRQMVCIIKGNNLALCSGIREVTKIFSLLFIKTRISYTHAIEASRGPCVYPEITVARH